MENKNRFGVALSGGGYRAAAFHIGTLRALERLRILQHVDVISTISGGSITGAAYCLSDRSKFAEFDKKMVTTLQNKSVIRFILLSRTALFFFGGIAATVLGCVYLLFTTFAWTILPILGLMMFAIIRFQFRLFPVSKVIERAYDNFFFDKRKLKDLPVKPELVIGSTNLQTSTPFVFSKKKMEDSNYKFRKPQITFRHEKFPVARAVVASSCVPFAFSPVSISKEFFTDPAHVALINPKLVDGGVFDNQGIHKITSESSSYFCPSVLVSDAGNKLPFEQAYNNTIILLIRTVDVFMDRIKGFQMAQNLYRREKSSKKEIAYQSLGWDLDECIPRFVQNMIDKTVPDAVVAAHGLNASWVAEPERFRSEIENYLFASVNFPAIKALAPTPADLAVARKVGTNLTKLSHKQVTSLAAHADRMTELQLKLYCPQILKELVSTEAPTQAH